MTHIISMLCTPHSPLKNGFSRARFGEGGLVKATNLDGRGFSNIEFLSILSAVYSI